MRMQRTVPETRTPRSSNACQRPDQSRVSGRAHGGRVNTQLSAIQLAVLAVSAAAHGDTVTAQRHLAAAERSSRTTARRRRQLVEIASLTVAGHLARAAGLALEHTNEFPGDAELLTVLAPCDHHPRPG